MALVLGRRVEQKVVITCGDVEITVQVVDARRGSCRLAFEAPDDVRIDREEIHKLRKNNDH